jgi:hypothetical protein
MNLEHVFHQCVSPGWTEKEKMRLATMHTNISLYVIYSASLTNLDRHSRGWCATHVFIAAGITLTVCVETLLASKLKSQHRAWNDIDGDPSTGCRKCRKLKKLCRRGRDEPVRRAKRRCVLAVSSPKKSFPCISVCLVRTSEG